MKLGKRYNWSFDANVYCIAVVFIIAISGFCYAQTDTIFLKNGFIIPCKIEKVGKKDVYYKLPQQAKDSVITVNESEVKEMLVKDGVDILKMKDGGEFRGKMQKNENSVIVFRLINDSLNNAEKYCNWQGIEKVKFKNEDILNDEDFSIRDVEKSLKNNNESNQIGVYTGFGFLEQFKIGLSYKICKNAIIESDVSFKVAKYKAGFNEKGNLLHFIGIQQFVSRKSSFGIGTIYSIKMNNEYAHVLFSYNLKFFIMENFWSTINFGYAFGISEIKLIKIKMMGGSWPNTSIKIGINF